MSCKQKRGMTLFLCVVTLYLYTFHVCHSVSLGQREDGFTAHKVQRSSPSRSWERIEQLSGVKQGNWRLVEQVNKGANVHPSNQPSHHRVRRESPVFPGNPMPYFNIPKLDETGGNFAPNSLSWVAGNVRVGPGSSGSEHAYQADFTGFNGVEGKVLGPISDSSPHFPEWLSVRPVVRCHHSVMTFTASGQGFPHLLVDREGASPVSLFHLPPNCGYSVRTSQGDLEIMVPYDACYIIQEDGSYVLPMLWWGSPLKLSCPVQSAPAPLPSVSAPLVFCSSYAMTVHIFRHKQTTQLLKVMVNGGWHPFVSKECAYRGPFLSEELTFFIPYSAACITIRDGWHLHLALDKLEYILSCPDDHQPPYVPSPPSSSPDVPQFPSVQGPGTPVIPSPPQSPTQEQTPQLPIYPYDPYPGIQYPQFPQLYPPGPQPAHPLAASPGSPSLLQPPQQPFTYPTGPVDPYLYFSGLYYPYMPFKYPPMTPDPTPATPEITVPPAPQPSRQDYPQYYFALSYYPAAQMPEAPSPPSPPKQPQYQFSPFYPPAFHHHPFSHPSYYPSHPLPEYPEIYLPTTTTPAPTRPPPKMPYVQCLRGRMTVFLPFAHSDSIEIRDQTKTWLLLSSVSALCGYTIKMAEGSGVILHSPLPACHSKSRTPRTFSLLIRFWDLSTAQHRTVEPECSYESPSEITEPLKQPVFLSPPSTTRDELSPVVLPKPKVSCSSHQMTVELPSGPISEIIVKDIRGNQMNLQDAPKHCGYSARRGRDDKIHLSLQLHSRCHMREEGKMHMITVIYKTVNGLREGHFSCPVVVPGAGRECKLPSEQHLPCGPGPVSQSQCLSMGCCFSKHPPACYYPMDECTIDRHFVFSVPASLTEPPLSPSMLVTAGNSTCKPQRVTSEFALFKIPMDGCGARRVVLGQAVVYMVEVVNKVHAISLNYGTITRDSPVRLLVECRFLPGTVLTVGYMVKTPTLGPGVQTQGTLGVQLRIAKDAQYSSYYPQYHQPLQMLLGKPLYLEVRLLNTPDPSLVLLVHFCVAYPRSATSVWVLLYNGCPNPLDPALKQAVLSNIETSFPRGQTRRFTISTFQFLPDGEFMDPDEEIYFMCSTEICSPRDGPCVEGCFGQ